MVDMQLEHATKASLPSPRFPGEQGWYCHQGREVGRDGRLVHRSRRRWPAGRWIGPASYRASSERRTPSGVRRSSFVGLGRAALARERSRARPRLDLEVPPLLPNRSHAWHPRRAAAYVPRYRLPREVIAREWGGCRGPASGAVANHDEDSLTMAINAALALPADLGRPTASSSRRPAHRMPRSRARRRLPRCSRSPATARTLDVGATLRAGTSAVLAALDMVAAGAATRVLVAGADCRLGEPESAAEQSFGDAGAGARRRRGAGLAEVVATHSAPRSCSEPGAPASRDFRARSRRVREQARLRAVARPGGARGASRRPACRRAR